MNPKVFLGGTCNNSKWRNKVISQLDVPYFNPVVSDWNDEAKEREEYEKENCSTQLYVITPLMEGVFSIAEAVNNTFNEEQDTIFVVLKTDTDKNGKEITFNKHQLNSLEETGKLIHKNGGLYFGDNLDKAIEYINAFSLEL